MSSTTEYVRCQHKASIQSGGSPARRSLSLVESCEDKWLKLPHAVMKDVGPACQTLAVVLAWPKMETYAGCDTIASRAVLPLATAKKHLAILTQRKWLDHKGRFRRRTVTRSISQKCLQLTKPYGVLPLWACYPIDGKKLSWGAKAVFSLVMARLMGFKAKVEEQARFRHASELSDVIATRMGGDGRFGFSLSQIARDTGLDHKTIIAAKRQLKLRKLLYCLGRDPGEPGGPGIDTLAPNLNAQIVVTTSCDGYYVHVEEA